MYLLLLLLFFVNVCVSVCLLLDFLAFVRKGRHSESEWVYFIFWEKEGVGWVRESVFLRNWVGHYVGSFLLNWNIQPTVIAATWKYLLRRVINTPNPTGGKLWLVPSSHLLVCIHVLMQNKIYAHDYILHTCM